MSFTSGNTRSCLEVISVHRCARSLIQRRCYLLQRDRSLVRDIIPRLKLEYNCEQASSLLSGTQANSPYSLETLPVDRVDRLQGCRWQKAWRLESLTEIAIRHKGHYRRSGFFFATSNRIGSDWVLTAIFTNPCIMIPSHGRKYNPTRCFHRTAFSFF